MSIVRKQESEIVPMSEERAREIQGMSDEDIDYTDIPPLDEAFFQNAKLVNESSSTEAICISVDIETSP